MSRLVFSKTLDKYPNLKIIVHHMGAMVPYHEGRVGPGWDQLGKRTTDEDYFALLKSLKKRPLDYFKQDFKADTAVFGSRAATVCGLEFYGADNVVFASDCPFDPEGGTSTSARPSRSSTASISPKRTATKSTSATSRS